MPGTNHKFDKIEPLVPSYIGTSDPKPYAYGSGMNAGYLSQDDPNDLPKQLGMPREQFYTYSRLIQNDRVLAKYRNEDTYVHPIVPHFVKQELGDYNYVEGKGERDPEMQPFAKGAKDLAVYMAHRQANENDEIIKCTQIREGSDPDCKKCNPDFCKSKVPCGVKLNAEQSRSALDEAAEEAADAKELSKFYPQKNRFFGAPCPPLLDMDLRNHTVWEGMTAKFIIKGTGNPKPTCQFFHNNIPIEVNLHAPGKYRITENASGMHVLEISRITIKDGGIIKAQLQNHKGAIDSIGFLNVRRHTDAKYGYFDIKSGYNLTIPSAYPDVENLNVPGYPRFVTRLHNKVCFEQDAVTLCCKVDGKPAPDVFWTLNGKTVQHIPGHIEVEFDKRSGLTSLTIYNAHTDDEGEYCVRAYNTDGAASSKAFLFVKGRKGPPSAPTQLEHISKDSTHIMLQWKLSGYKGWYNPPPCDGYLIEYCEANFPSLKKESCRWKAYNKDNLALLSRHPVINLDPDTPWFFRVRAINKWGTSPPSRPIGPLVFRDPGQPKTEIEIEEPTQFLPPAAEEICVEEEEPELVPGVPSDVYAKFNSQNTVSVWFSEPVDQEGNPEIRSEWQKPLKEFSDSIDGYLVEYAVEGSEDWQSANTDPIKFTTDPYPVGGLEDGKSYRFRVRAVNSYGKSDASGETDAVVCESEQKVPEQAPMQQEQMSEEQMSVHGSESGSMTTATATETTFTGTGMTTTDATQTTMSATTIAEPQFDRHYRGPPTCPETCDFRKSYRDFIEVCWQPPRHSGGDAPCYYLEKSKLGSGEWSLCNQIATKFTQFVVNGLEMGEKYIFRVRGVNQYGTSPFSDASEPVVAYDGIKPPSYYGAVQSFCRLMLENGIPVVSRNKIGVCWDAPQRDNGATILGYHLEMRPVGGKFKPVNNKGLNQRHFTITEGLNENEGYQFRVCAFNISGCSAWIYLPGKVVAKEPELPAAPKNVWITGLSPEWCSMKWEKPAHFGDGEFKGYLIEKRKEGSDLWLPVNKHAEMCPETRYRADALVTGNTYFFRVFAVNAFGKSEPSMQSCFVRPGEPWREVEIRQEAMYAAYKAALEKAEADRLAALEKEKKNPFLATLEDYWTTSGNDAHFEVEVKNEDWDVEWFYGNDQETPITPGGKFHVIKIGRIRKLIVADCSHDDIQVINVKCFGVLSQADLMVDQTAPAHWVERLGDQDCPKGSDCFMRVTVTQDIAEVKWYKSGPLEGERTELTIEDIGDHFEIINQGHQRCLIIRGLTYDDIATYTVEGPGGKSTCCLSVDGFNPVQFKNPGLEDQLNVKHTQMYVEFEVDVITSHKDGHKQPDMQWLYDDKPGFYRRDGRDGREITFEDEQFHERVEIVSNGNRRTLRIHCPKWDDSGRYTIYHPGGFATCLLKVLPPPPPPAPPLPSAEDTILHFKKGLRAEHKIGGARLYTEVENLPDDIIVTWTKNGKELMEDARHQLLMDYDTGVVSVEIDDIQPADAGRYQVSFVTPLGMFDTRVNYEFSGDLFKAIMRKAKDMKEDEEIIESSKPEKKAEPEAIVAEVTVEEEDEDHE